MNSIYLRLSFFKPFIKYGIVGASTALIYFALMWILDVFFGFTYFIVITLAYLIATIFHFFLNKYFTFNVSEGFFYRQITRYFIILILNYVITLFIVTICVKIFHLSPYLGVCFSLLITMFLGFILGRYWIFESKKEAL